MSTSGLCKRSNCVTRIGTTESMSASKTLVIPPALDQGEFNTSNVDSLIDTFAQNIFVSPGDNDPINTLIKEYGSDSFYLSVSAVNLYFSKEAVKNTVYSVVTDTGRVIPGTTTSSNITTGVPATGTTTSVPATGTTVEKYPLLKQRIETGIPFSPIEIAEFTLEFGYTPNTLSLGTTVVSEKIPDELESFYTQNFTSSTMGSFCALLPNIFGAIGGFFSLIDDVKNLINKFKNFALNFSLKALIDQIKNKIKNVIDKVINKVKNIIENLSIENVISKIKSTINEKIAGKFQSLKEQALVFFDKLNIENFKKKIDGLIDYATNLFKNPKIEEIQFLLYRFCSLAALVEDGINSLKNPVENFLNAYNQTVNVLQGNSADNSARAVRAGAIRYTTPRKEAGINTTSERWERSGALPPLTGEDFKAVPGWNEGKGAPGKIEFVGRWVKEEGRDGWEKVDIKVRAMLVKVQKDFGRTLYVNSAYRNKERNAKLKNAARNSLHIQGLALDISWPGINPTTREEFIRIARYHGFTGIGRYGPTAGNFVHIDVGPNRTWSEGI